MSTTKPSRKKSADIVRLCVPVFFNNNEDVPNEVVLNSDDIINGAGLYGDMSKREGLSYALAWADAHKKQTRIVEIVVDMGGRESQKALRMDEEMILSGKYGMLRFEKYATKIDLYNKISHQIELVGKKRFPRAAKRSGQEWLVFDSSLAREIFAMFKHLELVVVDGTAPYFPKGKTLSIAYIRDRSRIVLAQVLYEKIRVSIDGSSKQARAAKPVVH